MVRRRENVYQGEGGVLGPVTGGVHRAHDDDAELELPAVVEVARGRNRRRRRGGLWIEAPVAAGAARAR